MNSNGKDFLDASGRPQEFTSDESRKALEAMKFLPALHGIRR